MEFLFTSPFLWSVSFFRLRPIKDLKMSTGAYWRQSIRANVNSIRFSGLNNLSLSLYYTHGHCWLDGTEFTAPCARAHTKCMRARHVCLCLSLNLFSLPCPCAASFTLSTFTFQWSVAPFAIRVCWWESSNHHCQPTPLTPYQHPFSFIPTFLSKSLKYYYNMPINRHQVRLVRSTCVRRAGTGRKLEPGFYQLLDQITHVKHGPLLLHTQARRNWEFLKITKTRGKGCWLLTRSTFLCWRPSKCRNVNTFVHMHKCCCKLLLVLDTLTPLLM